MNANDKQITTSSGRIDTAYGIIASSHVTKSQGQLRHSHTRVFHHTHWTDPGMVRNGLDEQAEFHHVIDDLQLHTREERRACHRLDSHTQEGERSWKRYTAVGGGRNGFPSHHPELSSLLGHLAGGQREAFCIFRGGRSLPEL